jgi:hypothetical protein
MPANGGGLFVNPNRVPASRSGSTLIEQVQGREPDCDPGVSLL